MLTKKLNGCTLEMYDSIDMLPIENYINYNRLTMLDAGIGSDLNAVMNHWIAIQRYCENGDKESLNNQLANYRQALTFIVSNVSPKMLSFVSLIHKIDGKVIEDFSDENVGEILKQLSKKGLTVQMVESFLEFFKKKVDTELETYQIGGVTPETKEFYGKLKNRALIQLRGIQGKRPNYEAEIELIDKAIIDTFKPQKFDGKEVQLIRQFEKTCGLLTKHMGIQTPEKLTVRKYYMRLLDLKDQFKETPKGTKNGSGRQNSNK